MDTFFSFLKKGLVATVFIMFGLVATYVPQDWNKVELAHAGPGAGLATEATQVLNKLELIPTNIATTASWALDKITSFATNSLFFKEYTLDGIAWYVAKAIVSSMVQSLINWINSGFKGSPMFVQDLQRFLLDVADRAVGEYIDELGGIGSFICSPFRLDVQIAVALQYQQTRLNQPAPDCTLTGIIDNIEGFMSGQQGSFSQGGWNDWIDITSAPEVYTPYGATLAAQTGASIRVLNARGEEATKLEWGDGFLSGEICQIVQGANTTKEECFISKPGKIIEEALSFNIDSSRQALITADEIDEVIGALLGQLAQTALTGAAGLLGLSGGTGYTYSGFNGGSYLDAMGAESFGADPAASMQEALETETAYRNLALNYKPQLQAFAADPSNDDEDINAAKVAVLATDRVINTTTANINTLTPLIAQYDDPNTTATERSQILSQFSKLSLYTQYDMDTSKSEWDAILGLTPTNPTPTTPNPAPAPTVTDADGNTYGTISLGTQTWLDRNMNVGTRVNGESDQTDNGTLEKYCYDDLEARCTTDGALYQWDEAMQYSTTDGAQGICPSGYHVPTDNDWKTLEIYLGMSPADADEGGWRGTDQNTKLMASGSSGMDIPLAGYWNAISDLFFKRTETGYLWSSTESEYGAWFRRLESGFSTVNRDSGVHEDTGFSVRCLKN